MSTIQTASYRRQRDHFEPQDADPAEQRRLRGLLEQIDYSAFVANREVIGSMLPKLDAAAFQKLAILTATARAKWVAESLRQSESGAPSTPDQIARLDKSSGVMPFYPDTRIEPGRSSRACIRSRCEQSTSGAPKERPCPEP